MSKILKHSTSHCQTFAILLITFTVIGLQESSGERLALQNEDLNLGNFKEAVLTPKTLNISSNILQPIIKKSRVSEFMRSSEAKSNKILIPSLLACSLFFLLMISYRNTKGQLMTGIAGPQSLPFIGSLYVLAGSHEHILPKLSIFFEKHGGRVLMWMGSTPLVILAQIKDIEKILSSPKFVQKSVMYDPWLKWVFGEGLITSEGETWKVDRKLLNPSFKYQRFDGFLDSFNKHGNVLVSIISQRSTTNAQGHDLHQELTMCTADSILESSFGVPSDLQNNPNTEALESLNSVLESIRVRMFKPWLSFPIIREIFGRANQERKDMKMIKDFFRTICSQRNQLTGTNGLDSEITKPFVNALLGHRSDENIFDHMVTTFGAGFDTTATAMRYILYLLALHPDHQAKVQEELDQVFENNPDRDATFTDLAKIKYLEMCIKETLRLYPPAPLMARLIESDLELEKNVVLHKGSEVLISIYHAHRDPLVYPDPEKFDPERFLPAACANRSLYAFIPFSMGPRNCIGQKYGMLQLKVLLSCILRNFSISTTLRREDLRPIPGIVLEPNVKLSLTLTKRIC